MKGHIPGLGTVATTLLLAALLFISPTSAWGNKDEKVLLKNIQSLTFRHGRKSAHRRVHAIPQLTCRGRACRFYHIDILRCTNAGTGYSEHHPEWTCTADVPKFFKLGATDVHCEGYESSEDPYILKGSCGAEYRLLFTDEGLDHYGTLENRHKSHHYGHEGTWLGFFFKWTLISLVVGYVAWAAWRTYNDPPERRRRTRGVAGPDWRGGGGGGGGPPRDPPPPYDPFPPSDNTRRKSNPGGRGWTPGFWSGLASGVAGGYLAGRGTSRFAQSPAQRQRDDVFGPGMGGGRRDDDFGEGSSSGTYSSTGFGSTVMR